MPAHLWPKRFSNNAKIFNQATIVNQSINQSIINHEVMIIICKITNKCWQRKLLGTKEFKKCCKHCLTCSCWTGRNLWSRQIKRKVWMENCVWWEPTNGIICAHVSQFSRRKFSGSNCLWSIPQCHFHSDHYHSTTRSSSRNSSCV